FNGLRELRLKQGENKWDQIVQTELLSHPVKEVVHLDPITQRSFLKPRGYPGDAVLLDMIYDHPSVCLDKFSETGKKICEFTSGDHAASAVRYRRQYIGRYIDYLAEKIDKPKILSVACGHLREAEISDAVQKGAVGKFIALDQDEKSLAVVHSDYGHHGVTARLGSVRGIVKKEFQATGFDFIYSAGLYDYLNQKVAKTLTRRLFDMLARGGRLLFTNFLPAIQAVGYMESYMDWQLIFRDEIEMMDIARAIPRNQVERIEMFVEKQENIVFLQIQKSK
ncbi:MAG: hypothetical protein ACE5I1_19220, partial [bacterium]